MSCPFTGTNIPTPLVKLSAKLDHFSQKGKKSLRIYSKTCRHKPMCQCRIFKSSGLIDRLICFIHHIPIMLLYQIDAASFTFSSYFSASYASVLTILSFSLERYLAICTPLYIFPMSDIKRAALVNIISDDDIDDNENDDYQVSSLCWIIALLASVPHLVFTQINYIDYPYQSGNYVCESAFCAMLDENIHPAVSTPSQTCLSFIRL